MKYLLDTHVFLWSLKNDKKLKEPVKRILVDPRNVIYTSVVSALEVSIKIKTDPRFKLKTSIKRAFEVSGFEILPILFEHALGIHKLPLHHKDPFDRILISQARAENLTLITADAKIWRYRLSLLKA